MAKRAVNAKESFLVQSRCGNCRFWKRLDDSDQMPREDILGDCVRFPPAVVGVTEDGESVQALPIVEAQHWCGEHGMAIN